MCKKVEKLKKVENVEGKMKMGAVTRIFISVLPGIRVWKQKKHMDKIYCILNRLYMKF